MSEHVAHVWCVTAPWCDERAWPPFLGHTRRGAIKEAKYQIGMTWRKMKRAGWYVTGLKMTWRTP